MSKLVHAATDRVRAAARGRWLDLLVRLAPDLAAAAQRPGRHVPCPRHGGRDGFRLFKDAAEKGGGCCNSCGAWRDGFELLMWRNGWDFGTCAREVAGALGLEQRRRPSLLPSLSPTPPPPDPERVRRSRERLRRLWREAVPLSHPAAAVARRYLARRGGLDQLALGSPVLRCHPALAYHDADGRRLGVFPGLLALVQDRTGQAITLHRTFLTLDGHKAPVAHPRKLITPPPGREISGSGAAIRLSDTPGRRLDLAEGIETSLSVQAALGVPVWAGISATILAGIVPPEDVRQVVIWADRDPNQAGLIWARKLQQRLWQLGLLACIRLPPKAHGAKADWADVWQASGKAAFPRDALASEVAAAC